MQKGRRYRFNLINLEKPSSQYNNGMQPVVYSELAAEQDGKAWFRRGENVCYYQNLYRKNKNGKKGTSCFTVTWTDVHDRDDDRVYYAYCLPYTQTDMRNKVRSLQQVEVPIPSLSRRSNSEGRTNSGCRNGSSEEDTPPPYVGTNTPAPRSPEKCLSVGLILQSCLWPPRNSNGTEISSAAEDSLKITSTQSLGWSFARSYAAPCRGTLSHFSL